MLSYLKIILMRLSLHIRVFPGFWLVCLPLSLAFCFKILRNLNLIS